MSLPQTNGTGSVPRAPARPVGARLLGSEGNGRVPAAGRRVLPGARGALGRLGSSNVPAHAGISVLSECQFQAFLERERSLADRGTRRFSLLVIRSHARSPAGGNDALARLVLQTCARLRSTDLLGRMDAQRVEILLADTEPAGAQVVAEWLEQSATRLGLALEQTIYVYPSVIERSSAEHSNAERNGTERSDESRHGPPDLPTRPTSGAASTSSNGVHKAAMNGKVHGHDGDGTSLTPVAAVRVTHLLDGRRWPLEDLWPLLELPTPPWKRGLDVLVASCALLALLPLLALIALAIRLDSPGPVIFRQLRAGRGGRPFVFYKFRSMIADAEQRRAELVDRNEQDGPIFKMRADPRVTRLGALLRRWSLDELPQLWNVLKGDISLVGPRSPTFDEVEKYERWQRRRLCITGGLTCFWQVSGRSHIPFRDWMRLDMRYVACRNLWLDLRLLALTLPAVLSGRGAC